MMIMKSVEVNESFHCSRLMMGK